MRVRRDFEQIGRSAYLLVVVLGAISVASLAFALTSTNDRIVDQNDRIEAQLKLLEAPVIAECHTRQIIEALATQTILLLRSQPPTPARLRTIHVFEGYVVILKRDRSCKRLEESR